MKSKLLFTLAFSAFFSATLFCQATVPAPFDMSGGASFQLTAFTGGVPPANMAIGKENNAINGTFVTPLTVDALHGPGLGKWNDEGNFGISFKGGASAERGCFLLALNTTGRQDITVDWKVRDIETDINTNYIELQYRVGSTGNFSDVLDDFYKQGTIPSGTDFTVQLPAAVNNQPLVYVRWIYYETGSGNGDQLAIDNILVATIVLPIELSRFDAQSENHTVHLSWETKTELNSARFIVERSANGVDYNPLESLSAAGNSLVRQTYNYTDHQPLPGRAYYRLKQVDFNGQFSYSPVRQVTMNRDGNVRLAPSLVVNTLHAAVTIPFTTDTPWMIFNASGRLLRSGTWPAETLEMTLQLADLSTGQYLLHIANATQQFVKQ